MSLRSAWDARELLWRKKRGEHKVGRKKEGREGKREGQRKETHAFK